MPWLQNTSLGEVPKGGGAVECPRALQREAAPCPQCGMLPAVGASAPGLLAGRVWKLHSWRSSHLAGNAETQSDKFLLLRVKRRLILRSWGSAGDALFKAAEEREALCWFNDRCVLLCERQQLGNPNEQGAQPETLWIKSSRLLPWQMLFLQAADMITVWMALRCDRSPWKFVMLDPKQRQTKACQIGIAYRCVGCLSSRIIESFLLKTEKNEKQFSHFESEMLRLNCLQL